jgi:hypothetical protein
MTYSRDLPADVIREINRQESPEFYLVFLRVNHRSIFETIRVVNDTKDFELGGFVYSKFAFGIELLTDGEGMPTARIIMQNVDRSIGEAVLNADSPAKLEIDVIAGSQFDLTLDPREPFSEPVEYVYQAKHLMLVDVEGDTIQLTGTLKTWDYTQEVWPGMRGTQNRFPGLFR